MKLWLLRPQEPWEPWYDKAFGFVVRAKDETSARALADAQGGDECGYGAYRYAAWSDAELTTCVELTADGEEEVVIRDFASA